jgi:ribosomal protein S18 acetylase RimI-like enzyme
MIRRAKTSEAQLVRNLVERAYTVYIERIGQRPAPMDEDYSKKTRQGEVFVADDGGIVGIIVLAERADHLLIENVAVDPSRQGTGIGRALLVFAETYAREKGIREVRLYTNEAMTENLALYLRHGFHEDERRAEDGFHRVYFSKRLTT